jgi:hypothetical protein
MRPNTALRRQLNLLFFTLWCGKAHGCTTEQWRSETAFYTHFRSAHLGKYELDGGWMCCCDTPLFSDAAHFMTHVWTTHMEFVLQLAGTSGPSVVRGQLPPSTAMPYLVSAYSTAVQGHPSLTVTGGSHAMTEYATPYAFAPLPLPSADSFANGSMGYQMLGPSHNNGYPVSAPTNNYPNNERIGSFNGSFDDDAVYWSEGTQSMPNTQIYPVTSATSPSGWKLPNGPQ